MRLMPATKDSLPNGDFRDWAVIDAWADGIARDLLGVATPETVAAPAPAGVG